MIYNTLSLFNAYQDKNSSGDEIANVNFCTNDNIHVQASAYAH